MLRYRRTVEAFCFRWLTLPYLRKLIFSLGHSSFLQFQFPFKLLAALRSRSCYCSTPSDLLTCGHITTSDAVPVSPFSLYFCRFRKNFVAIIVFAPQGRWCFHLLRNVSVVTRLMCLFIEHLTTLNFNRPILHILYAQSPIRVRSRLGKIAWYWTALFVTGLDLNGSLVWTIIFKSWVVFFFLLLTATLLSL